MDQWKSSTVLQDQGLDGDGEHRTEPALSLPRQDVLWEKSLKNQSGDAMNVIRLKVEHP